MSFICPLQQELKQGAECDNKLDLLVVPRFEDIGLPQEKTRVIWIPLGGWPSMSGRLMGAIYESWTIVGTMRFRILWITDAIVKVRYQDQNDCSTNITLTEAMKLATASECPGFYDTHQLDISSAVSRTLQLLSQSKNSEANAS